MEDKESKVHLVDSHAHIDQEQFLDDFTETLARARAAGVDTILVPALDEGNFDAVKAISDENKGIYFAWGIHPHSANGAGLDWPERIREEKGKNPRLVAVGEIGLDFHYSGYDQDKQEKVFTTAIQTALEVGLPIIVHSRDSDERVLDILEYWFPGGGLAGVWHCFSGDRETAFRALDGGFMLGFDGNLTYPKSVSLVEVMRAVPDDMLLLETDSPYLAPQPYRGRRNEPAYVAKVYEFVALERGTTLSQLAGNVVDNFTRLFL